MIYASTWTVLWIPYVRFHSDFGAYPVLCDRNDFFLRNGWEFGDQNPTNQPLNDSIYDIDSMELAGQLAIIEDLTADALAGKLTIWRGDIDGYCPLFVRPKKLHPITDEPIKYRVIRDGSKSTPTRPSLNSLIPDEYAALELVNHQMVQDYIVIMYILYGRGVQLAKCDLKGAFRQFYMKPKEAQKMLYKILGHTIGDLAHIWGTRTGSRICNDLTTLASRAMMIHINGPGLMMDINKAREQCDWIHFIEKHALNAPSTTNPHLQSGIVDVWNWTRNDVDSWLSSNELLEAKSVLGDIQRGALLLNFHETTVQRVHGDASVRKLKQLRFFEKLLKLKLDACCVLRIIITQYVDDFMLFLPPHADQAQNLFDYVCQWLSDNGFEEEISKREMMSTVMELLGITYDTTRMVMYLSDLKKRRMLKLLCRGHMQMAVTVEEYRTIVGKLTYAASLMWPAKAFLRRIRNRLQRIEDEQDGNPQYLVILEKWELKDWEWWIDYLRSVPEVDLLQRYRLQLPRTEIFVDGATNGSKQNGWTPGIGAWFEGKWLSEPVPARFLQQYESQHTDYVKDFAIAHFEMLSIVVAFHNLQHWIAPHHEIRLLTDNKHVQSALQKKDTHDEFLMNCVRWIILFAIQNKITFYVTYINTKHNVLADLASRFEVDMLEQQGKLVCDENGWEMQRLWLVAFPELNC